MPEEFDPSTLTDEEVREEYAKIAAQRERQREYMNRPEVKAKMQAYHKNKAAKRKAVLARAKELGLE